MNRVKNITKSHHYTCRMIQHLGKSRGLYTERFDSHLSNVKRTNLGEQLIPESEVEANKDTQIA